MAQLQQKLEKQNDLVTQLQNEVSYNSRTIQILEKKVAELEGQIITNKSLDFVRERVTEELKAQLVDLQQYTRRYSLVIAGVRTGIDETTTVAAVSSSKMEDVDKLHRVGPPKQGKQDIIVRFKSLTAKENFFKRKKTTTLKCDHHLPQKEENS